MTSNQRRAILAAASALTLVAASCSKPPAQQQHAMMFSVKSSPALKMDTPVVIEAFGNTKDAASVDVIPQVSGVLVKTLFEDGATVTNGQPLFQIDPSDYDARRRQAEAIVAAERASLKLSRGTLERNRGLLAKELISKEDFDKLSTQVQAAEAQLRADEAGLEQAVLNLNRCTVVAPLAGVCSKRFVDTGNLVAAGQSRLTNIRSYDPMLVDFSVSEGYLPALRSAMAAGTVAITVTPRGETNRYEGTLAFIDNAVSTQTGTIVLRGQVPNAGLKLWAGQFVDVRVIAGMIQGAVMVPESAIQYGKQGTYLFTVTKDSKAEMRPVRTGVRRGELIQIVQGVAPDDKVVVLGQLMLFPGAPVMDGLPPGMGAPPGAGGPPAAGAAKPGSTNAPAATK